MALSQYVFGIACGSVAPWYASVMVGDTQKYCLKRLRIASSGRLELYDIRERPAVPVFSRAALNLVLVNLHEKFLQFRESI